MWVLYTLVFLDDLNAQIVDFRKVPPFLSDDLNAQVVDFREVPPCYKVS